MATRDLELAQISFEQNDVELSKRAHDVKREYGPVMAQEDHR
jgi:hypothetical protein